MHKEMVRLKCPKCGYDIVFAPSGFFRRIEWAKHEELKDKDPELYSRLTRDPQLIGDYYYWLEPSYVRRVLKEDFEAWGKTKRPLKGYYERVKRTPKEKKFRGTYTPLSSLDAQAF